MVNEWIFSQYTGSVTGRFVFNITSTGGFQINVSSTNSLSTTNIPAITIGNWHHVVVVKDGSNGWTLYADGQPHSTWASTASIITNQNTILGGDDSVTSNNLDGKLDQVRIYDSALSAANVTALYNEIECPAAAVTNAFNTVTYTGTSGTQSITGVGFQPDLVWAKNRTAGTTVHILSDSVRGIKQLTSSGTDAEGSSTNMITSYDSDGFGVGDAFALCNGSGYNFVAWNWKAGGTAVTNTDGTITSTVSANPDAGFSIVKYTGESAARTVGHGLFSAPEMVIIKNLDDARNWVVYHKDLSASSFLFLNLSNAEETDTRINGGQPRPFGPFTSTTFGVNIDNETGHTNDYIAYCFHSVDGYQKVGSYAGTGASGNAVTTGFETRFVLLRSPSSGRNWMLYDSVTDTGTVPYDNSAVLFTDSPSIALPDAIRVIHFTSHGFVFHPTYQNTNGSEETHIFLAIA